MTDALHDARLDPRGLRLEVAESSMMDDPEATRRVLSRLFDEHSVAARIDDFGLGASSLRQLHRFPGDAVKMDRTFVVPMLEDEAAHDIVRAIVALAHNLGMEVIAEGVETQEHLDRLKLLGCEYAQGFYIAGPARRGRGDRAAGPRDGRRDQLNARRRRCALGRAPAAAVPVPYGLAARLALGGLVDAALLVLGVGVAAGAGLAGGGALVAGGVAAVVRASAVSARVVRGVVVVARAGDALEAVALVVLDELVVGEAALVQLRLGLEPLGLGALGLRLLLGDDGLLLGPLGLGGARRSGLAVLGRDALAATLELLLGLTLLQTWRACAAAAPAERSGSAR